MPDHKEEEPVLECQHPAADTAGEKLDRDHTEAVDDNSNSRHQPAAALVELVELTAQQTSLLTSQYGVVQLILSHLPCRELYRARAVCRVWRDVANIVLRQRRAIGGAPLWDSEPVPDGGTATETAGIVVRRLLAQCHAEPGLALFFHALKARSGRRKAMPQLAKFLPSNCMVAGLTSLTGCVATAAGDEPLEDQNGNRVGVLLLPPPCAGAQAGAVTLRVRTPATAEQLRGMMPEGVWDGLRAALLFFTSRRGSHAAAAVANLILSEFGGSVAVAGGWTDLMTPRAPTDALLVVYFSGPAVRAASVVIQDFPNGPETMDTEAGARLLAEQKLPADNSVAFMVACCGRGEYAFEPGYEVSQLAHHVPGVPVFGAFVNGELGYLSLPADEERSREAAANNEDVLMSYTTLFLQVHFSREQKKNGQSTRN